MMGYWGNGIMGSNWQTIGTFMGVFWIIVLVDLVLLGLWLWKQLQKKKGTEVSYLTHPGVGEFRFG